VIDNDVIRIRAAQSSGGSATGIYLINGAMGVENRVSDVSAPSGNATGIGCPESTPKSRIRGNIVVSSGTAYSGCLDLGNND
jgi:hypothetical protein